MFDYLIDKLDNIYMCKLEKLPKSKISSWGQATNLAKFVASKPQTYSV